MGVFFGKQEPQVLLYRFAVFVQLASIVVNPLLADNIYSPEIEDTKILIFVILNVVYGVKNLQLFAPHYPLAPEGGNHTHSSN